MTSNAAIIAATAYFIFLPNVEDERDGYLARSVRQHDP
jgi:hypothetical protein